MTETCSNCFFARLRSEPHSLDAGRTIDSRERCYCHYWAPKPGEAADWKEVEVTEWCGHWSADGTTRMQAVGPTGATGATGAAGAAGAQGPQGDPGSATMIYYSARDNTDGAEGESYILVGAGTSLKVNKKIDGVWVEQVSLLQIA